MNGINHRCLVYIPFDPAHVNRRLQQAGGMVITSRPDIKASPGPAAWEVFTGFWRDPLLEGGAHTSIGARTSSGTNARKALFKYCDSGPGFSDASDVISSKKRYC
jgi:hypothetical protein